MTNFINNYRETGQNLTIPVMGGGSIAPTTFRNANNNEEVATQKLVFKNRNGDTITAYAIVPAQSKRHEYFETYGGLTAEQEEQGLTDKEAMSNIRDYAYNKTRPRMGVDTGANGTGEGEILGGETNEGSLTAKGMKDYINRLGQQGYFLAEYQTPTRKTDKDPSYLFGDFLRNLFNTKRLTYGADVSFKNNENGFSDFINNLRRGGGK